MTTLHALISILSASLYFAPHCSSFGFVPKSTSQLRPPSFHLLSHHGAADEESARRRTILAAPALLLPFGFGGVANAAETSAEAIRLLSAKSIPGLGPPDIYYPPYFVGKWKVTKVITTSDENFWKEMKDKGVTLPVAIMSEMRFVPYDAGKDFSGDENPNNVPAIADRAFNEQSYYDSLSGELNRIFASTRPMPSIQSLNWTPTNPNVLALAYTDGSSKEVKVTKRMSDVSKDGSSVFSSEFRRLTDVPASASMAGGIPSILKSRVLTKWKQGSNGTNNPDGGVNVIEGIEISYKEQGTFGQSADPLLGGKNPLPQLYGDDSSKDMSEWKSTKTKILMERIVG